MFSGQFAEALQALVDWLYRVEPQLAEDQPVHGDLDLVSNLMDSHKVQIILVSLFCFSPLLRDAKKYIFFFCLVYQYKYQNIEKDITFFFIEKCMLKTKISANGMRKKILLKLESSLFFF